MMINGVNLSTHYGLQHVIIKTCCFVKCMTAAAVTGIALHSIYQTKEMALTDHNSIIHVLSSVSAVKVVSCASLVGLAALAHWCQKQVIRERDNPLLPQHIVRPPN